MSTPTHSMDKTRKQLMMFVLAGGTAALINIIARWCLSFVFFYELAVTVAYLLGMTSAFLLSRTFVFAPGSGHWLGEYGRFALVNAASFLIVLGISTILARLIFPAVGFEWHAKDVAHIIGVISPILFSFHAHKHYSFRGGARPS